MTHTQRHPAEFLPTVMLLNNAFSVYMHADEEIHISANAFTLFY